MRIVENWFVVFVLFLYVLSPVTGVVLGMVYVHDWAAGHRDFLLQDFFLVTVLALAGGQVVAPVLLAAVSLALSLVALAVAACLAAVFVPVLVAFRTLRVVGVLALSAAETIAAMLAFPRCLYCGHHHEKAMVWAPPHRWGAARRRAAGS